MKYVNADKAPAAIGPSSQGIICGDFVAFNEVEAIVSCKEA